VSDDWRRPISRYATNVVNPDTGEVLLRRPEFDADKPIPEAQYRRIEVERKQWLKLKLEEEQVEEELRRAEIQTLRVRQMGRDSLEETADKVYAKLGTWTKYVDIARWAQLLEWLEGHPQRIAPQDEQFLALDGRLEQLLGFPISTKPKTGRGQGNRGRVLSAEQKSKQSEAMKKRWDQWRRDGRTPSVGRPPEIASQEDEAPY
jgi:hypothetical protein